LLEFASGKTPLLERSTVIVPSLTDISTASPPFIKLRTSYEALPPPSPSPQHMMSQPEVQQQRTTRPAPAQPSQPRKVKFSVGTEYQVKDVIGEGAYGIVVSAIRRRDGHKVAIKKVSCFV
jgi:mitogen-activated protein kinase 1/3